MNTPHPQDHGQVQMQDQWQQQWHRDGFYGATTLDQVIRATAARHPDRYVVLDSDVRPDRQTLASIFAQSEQAAAAMQQLGVRPGAIVAMQLPNWIEALVLCQACQLLGAVMLPITHILGPAELDYIVRDAGASLLFIPAVWRGRDYREQLGDLQTIASLQRIVVVGDSPDERALGWSDFLAAGAGHPCPQSPARADDVALLIYTSGTTAKPKGVLHSHNSLLCDVRNSALFWGDAVDATYLSPWPFGHIAALVSFTHIWHDGVNMVLADRWNPLQVARLVEQHRVGSTAGVPYFLESLLDTAEAHGIDISALTNYGIGATNVPAALVERCNKLGINCYRLYGSTEHPTITGGLPDDPLHLRISTEGRCLPGNRLRILDDAGRDLPVGAEGEIATIGPERFLGYRDRARNLEAFTADGWFLTGDIGRVDAQGFLTITDRKKDIIIRGGENISSREVEECLQRHPAVAEAAAVAIPDARLGEKVCVFVVLQPGQSLTLADIDQHFKDAGMARQKTPEHLRTIASLPRNATGKVLKDVLRKQLQAVTDM